MPLHPWPPGPSSSLLSKFMAVSCPALTLCILCSHHAVEGRRGPVPSGTGCVPGSRGDPPRIWPLVCAVRSSLRNFSPGQPYRRPTCGCGQLQLPAVSLLLNSSNFSFPLGNRMSLQRRMNNHDDTLGNRDTGNLPEACR